MEFAKRQMRKKKRDFSTNSCEFDAKKVRFIEVSGSWFIQQFSWSHSLLHTKTTLPLVINNSEKRKKKAFHVSAFVTRNLQQLFPFVYDNLFFLLHHLNVIISFTMRVGSLSKKSFFMGQGNEPCGLWLTQFYIPISTS